jgi:hypothetical protein
MPSHQPVCSGPIHRRDLLRVGSLALGGLGLADLLQLRATASTGVDRSDTAVIFVWLPGGPPHLETYDMKPEAPAEYRGIFRPIKTVVEGLEVCELLPKQAQVADRFNIIRSISHDFADHGGGHKRFLTGRIPQTPTGTENDAPAVGSIVARQREHIQRGVPNYVAATDGGRGGVDVFAFGAAYLGQAYTPFTVAGNPNKADFQIHDLSVAPSMERRLDDRAQLLAALDRLRRDIDASGAMASMDQFNRKALELLTGPEARKAFDLSQEDPRVRDMYGRHPYGQRCLMARRLIEAGSSFVTVVLENPASEHCDMPRNAVYNWDSHAVNCHIFEDARFRFPFYDQAIAALVEDLYARGLDQRVLLVVTGEFGRTPRIETSIGTQTGTMQPGRDHWPAAMSILVAGGGMRTGQIIGSTTAKGEVPKDRPLTPNDLWATVYRHLGIDYEQSYLDHSGRPMPILPFGEPIRELL